MANESVRFFYLLKNYIVMVLLFADLILNAFIDHIDHVESNVLSFAIIGLQIVLRIVMLFILILLMWDTFVFKQGLLGVLCRQFKGVFICSPISFVLMLVLRAMKLSATASKTLLLDQWSTPSYQALYFLHNIMSAVLYVVYFSACFSLGSPVLFRPSAWSAEEV